MKDFSSAKFISFEGGEGCGKSTQCMMLRNYLLSQGVEVILTREPGGTPEAEKIRDILLHSELLPITELMLVMAARYEHLNKIIIPALNNNVWVICDRFVDSTAVYQGQYLGMVDKVYELHKELMLNKMPDITFMINTSVSIALSRARIRGGNNKFEDRAIGFHTTIHNKFLEISKQFKNRIINITTRKLSKEEVHDKIISCLIKKV